ncbi:MAG: LysR family transcriptional regulator [Ottowia sp.]|uniref:LysR family transcriptional regulator n=1 Tax=Ottowia sp. TaxID=1898956 RepID=UPI003C73276E
MDIRQLKHFVALAETLNFRRAAERLHIAQPPLSASIRKLEERLGVVLFERTRRGTRLTAAGQAALDDARKAIRHAEKFGRVARAVDSGDTGVLKVGFIGSAIYALLPRVLPIFVAEFPDIQLKLHESSTTKLLASIENREIDLGIVRFPIAREGRFRLKPVELDTFVAAIPAGSSWAAKKVLSLSELAKEPFIMYDDKELHGAHTFVIQLCQLCGFIPRVSHCVIHVQTLISLVEMGQGVALVPSVAMRYGVPGVVFRHLSDLERSLPGGIALAWDPENEVPTAQRFVETMTQIVETEGISVSAQFQEIHPGTKDI